MAKQEIEELYCDVCDRFTKQTVYEPPQKDVSCHWRKCHKCGSKYSGLTGEWSKNNH